MLVRLPLQSVPQFTHWTAGQYVMVAADLTSMKHQMVLHVCVLRDVCVFSAISLCFSRRSGCHLPVLRLHRPGTALPQHV